MNDNPTLLQRYKFFLARGYSDAEAREASFGNEWDTPEDIAYRESLDASGDTETAR